ncbi:NAD(P)H-dependent oxidoreductase [Bacillus sp. AFS053548]|uniref:NAD(P)H-dependent oxidoreductase n=1 Tax=Bacillus sp. AFS053548 TaxID=2033505 RepID=UPI000BFE30F2|nr:NAD(P)H-dependent oxidoreductase [Bacillus sp. AFS053548]PGM50889.1 general stress protein [Bacillus sp. AFS053548]
MNTLVIITHPNLENSRINRTWMEELKKQEEITIHTLYQAYPDGKIDVEQEQKLLESHDRIILQFPFFWYSTPSLLKQWQDEVLAYGYAYGPDGDKLHGKELGLAISTFGPVDSYEPTGYNNFTMETLTTPLQQTSNLIGTKFMPLFVLNGVAHVSEEELLENAKAYVKHVTQPKLETITA